MKMSVKIALLRLLFTVFFIGIGGIPFNYEVALDNFWHGFVAGFIIFWSMVVGFFTNDVVIANSGGQFYNTGFFVGMMFLIWLGLYSQRLKKIGE